MSSTWWCPRCSFKLLWAQALRFWVGETAVVDGREKLETDRYDGFTHGFQATKRLRKKQKTKKRISDGFLNGLRPQQQQGRHLMAYGWMMAASGAFVSLVPRVAIRCSSCNSLARGTPCIRSITRSEKKKKEKRGFWLENLCSLFIELHCCDCWYLLLVQYELRVLL